MRALTLSLMAPTIVVLAIAPVSLATPAEAQAQFRTGGTLTRLTQEPVAELDIGGSTWAGSFVFGVQVSPRVTVEIEPWFVGPLSNEYTYSPFPAGNVRVVSTRRDVFVSLQLRSRLGALEPVAGVGYFRGTTSRDARFVQSGRPYSHDDGSDGGFAVSGGVDVAIPVTSRFFVGPTFRLMARLGDLGAAGLIGTDSTSPARFAARYGAAIWVTF